MFDIVGLAATYEMLENGKIFLTTVEAEASISIKKFKYIVDSGLFRAKIYDPELEYVKE